MNNNDGCAQLFQQFIFGSTLCHVVLPRFFLFFIYNSTCERCMFTRAQVWLSGVLYTASCALCPLCGQCGWKVVGCQLAALIIYVVRCRRFCRVVQVVCKPLPLRTISVSRKHSKSVNRSQGWLYHSSRDALNVQMCCAISWWCIRIAM